MKKLLALGMTTALLTTSLMGSAAFADATSTSSKETATNNTVIESCDYDYSDEDYLKYYKDILSKEDFLLFEKYEKEIEAAFNTETGADDEVAFAKSDKLLEKYESAMLKADEAFTAKEIFEIFDEEIKAENKARIETLAKILEAYRAAGDVANYDKTFEELEKLLPEFDDVDYDDADIDGNYDDMDGDYSDEFTIEEVKEMYPSMSKIDLTKIETLITEYNKLSDTDKDNKIYSFFDAFDKIAQAYDTLDNQKITLEDIYEYTDKKLSDKEKTEIKSLYEQISKLETAKDFTKADEAYDKLLDILFE